VGIASEQSFIQSDTLLMVNQFPGWLHPELDIDTASSACSGHLVGEVEGGEGDTTIPLLKLDVLGPVAIHLWEWWVKMVAGF
jgi:hypothetical protein